MEILIGASPDYNTIRGAVENLNNKFSIFGVNKECLAQVWSYSSCVKLFISEESYADVHNITSTDVCNIFEDKCCEAFVSDLMNTDFKCINENNSNEEVYKKIFESLKLTYLSTCSKTESENEYCPMVEFINSGTNITEIGTKEYEDALKSTCEDTSCNKSYSEVYKILYENNEDENEDNASTRRKRDIVISTAEDIDLEKAIDFLDNKQCVKFAKAMTNQDTGATQDSGSILSSKVNMPFILLVSVLTLMLLF